MDLSKVKAKMEALKKENSGGKDYKKGRFKPSPGKQVVRILPNKFNPDMPIQELLLHYNKGKRIMISPINFGEKDPLMEFAEKLREGDYEKEKYKLSKNVEPKSRYFAQVIVRGKESEGVKIWEFGQNVYEELLAYALDEDCGDFTDISEGRDFKLDTTSPEQNGTPYNKTTLRPNFNTSVISEDAEQVEKWLNEQENPKDLYKVYSYQEMKQALMNWLEGKDDDDDETPKSQKEHDERTIFPPKKEKKEESIVDGPATDFENENEEVNVGKEDPKQKFKDLFEN